MGSAFLVIGIGNTLRRDDGAGWLFARGLGDALCDTGAEAEVIVRQQLTPELAEVVAEHGVAHVVFVDASTEIMTVALTAVPDAEATPPSSHHFTPATILAIARRLYGAEITGWLVHLPAFDFSHGEGLSGHAASSMNLADAIAAELLARANPR